MRIPGRRRLGRWSVAVAACAALAGAAVAGSPPAARAATSSGIATLATANQGKKACSVNSLGGTGYYSSCTGNGGSPEYWCADFAKWVWAHNSVPDVGELTPAAASFYTYGVNHGMLTHSPSVGDAAVFSVTNSVTNIHHVAIVTAVNTNGTVTVENGDFGGVDGTEAQFASTSSVVRTTINATVGTRTAAEGTYLVYYVQPIGLVVTGHDSFGYYNPADGGTMHVRNALDSDGPWDAQWATNWPAGAVPLIGDWGGDGADGFGYYNPADRTMHLRDALNSSGPWDYQWATGWPAGAVPVVGNWDGVGGDGFGYYNPADGTMHLRNALNSSGPWDYQWATGWPVGAVPLVGNWDGKDGDGFGYYNPADGTMHLRNALNSSGPWDYQWSTGWPAGAVPLIGNWGGVGGDGFGYYNPADGTMHLRNELNSSGPWEAQWATGWPDGAVPLIGDWDGR